MKAAEKKIIRTGDILRPPFRLYQKGLACLYVMHYIGGYYYIGSTKCFGSRMSAHKTEHDLKYMMRKLKIKWEDLSFVHIVEAGEDVAEMRKLEEKMLPKHYKKAGCLNYSVAVMENYGRKKAVAN